MCAGFRSCGDLGKRGGKDFDDGEDPEQNEDWWPSSAICFTKVVWDVRGVPTFAGACSRGAFGARLTHRPLLLPCGFSACAPQNYCYSFSNGARADRSLPPSPSQPRRPNGAPPSKPPKPKRSHAADPADDDVDMAPPPSALSSPPALEAGSTGKVLSLADNLTHSQQPVAQLYG